MTVRIRYMGNKHALAGHLATVVAEQPPGPVVDLFCGMCSLAGAVAASGRPVWGNDVQAYASLAANCQTASSEDPLVAAEMAPRIMAGYSNNSRALKERFGSALKEENRALRAPSMSRYQRASEGWRHVGNDDARAEEAREMSRSPRDFPARLASITFAWGYFGLGQAIQLDSVRFGLDAGLRDGALSPEQHRWGLLALLQAASACASAPGHFAQYLRGCTERSFRRIVKQRGRDIWDGFLAACDELRPFGDPEWRRQNRCFQGDAASIWPYLDSEGLRRAVIYADPPYSRDQYSRYYHVLETLTCYDYPQATGAGRYRPDRFQTPFSLKTRVADAFASLFESVAVRNFTLVLSYPNNGLYLRTAREGLDHLLSRYFTRVKLALRRPQDHSTLGARHGSSKIAGEELVWVAA